MIFLKVFTISWEECLHSLKALVPAAVSLDLYAIDQAMRECCKFQWKSLGDWEELNDIEIFREAFGRDITGTSERGILIPDLCFWKKHLPFLVNGDFLEEFIRAFSVQYGEAFFSGDTVLLFPAMKTICLFDHNGMYITYKVQ